MLAGMHPTDSSGLSGLRWLPPPQRWAPLLRLLPEALPGLAFERAARHALGAGLGDPVLQELAGRRVGIEAKDLALRLVLVLDGGSLRALDPGVDCEVCVRGNLVDLLQLASRREDADTLFFQRRLELTGDVELGLFLRNLLDRLPWESLPLATRIVLQRGAALATDARAAWRAARLRRPP